MNSIYAHARAGSVIELTNGQLPTDLQWMPPGKNRVQPQGFTESFENNATATDAANLDRQLQAMLTDFASGRDVEPYLDINHKDEVKAFLPKKIFWGGDDSKRGGIRVQGKWNPIGVKAATEEGLNVVSPSWSLHRETKQILGIQRNLGGLVPRSAFYAMEAFAKADFTPEQLAQYKCSGLEPDGVKLAHKLAFENGSNWVEEFSKLCQANPEYWGEYIYSLTGNKAALKIQPPQSANAGAANHDFVVLAKAYGIANQISDVVEAQARFAGTPEGRAAYEQYVNTMR